MLLVLALLVLVTSLAAGAFHYGQTYFAEYMSQHVAYRLRHLFLARLHSLSFGFHDHQRTGDLMSRAASDVESIRWFVSFGLICSMHIAVTLIGVTVLLLIIAWDLALPRSCRGTRRRLHRRHHEPQVQGLVAGGTGRYRADDHCAAGEPVGYPGSQGPSGPRSRKWRSFEEPPK